MKPLVPRALTLLLPLLALSGCGGGGGGGPFGNPADVQNPAGTGGQKLAFAYFQKCIQPILVAQIALPGGGTANTCASGGCHSSVSGTGGALRLIDSAAAVDLTNVANTADVIRTTDMYKNFYSAQGVTVTGDPTQSRLINKPLLRNMLHGGGQIFASDQDPMAKLIAYWISHPAPKDQDEFSTATYSMFTPADPATGTCNTQ